MVVLPRSSQGFPMAPTQEVWARLTAKQRAEVVAALPDEVTDAEMSPPEGDWHFAAKVDALSTLRSWFRRQKRKVYLAAELPTYYPGAPRFAPDLLAVVDAEVKKRTKWVVSAEGKGLDWVMEVHYGGDRKKDAEYNVTRYAQLGIPEYFLYDCARHRLSAYRLPSAKSKKYTAIVPQLGRYASAALGLELQVEGTKLRFYAGTALLLETDEFVTRLEQLLADAEARAEEEARLRQEEARLRQEEAAARKRAEDELAKLRAKLSKR
ncbi:MAG: Uma2 family endonuclease [Myxococcaceae bacterium]|nr:Uma2 family endonuclease [Myxococcaceae bacterium]